MKKQLTIRLTGLIGGWTTHVRAAEYRLSDTAPSASHIRGLLAACLGYSRDEPWTLLDDLTYELEATQRPIAMVKDYQTIKGAVTNEGKPGRNATSTREYVVEPEIFVTIRGDEDVINRLRDAVSNPVFQPYLGRRCCVLSAPLLVEADDSGL